MDPRPVSVALLRGAARVATLALLCAAGACTGWFSPAPWSDYYDPGYPDHRMAKELCEAGTTNEVAFSRCMQETVVRYPDRRLPLLKPDILRNR